MKVLTFAVVILFSLNATGQFRGHNWVVPDSAGIDFTGVLPSVFFSSVSAHSSFVLGAGLVNVSCISSEQGDLLFYTNGKNVYDSNGDTMPGCSMLASGFSAYSGSLCLPYPGSEDSLYLIIHSWIATVYFDPGVYFTVVNMNKRVGLGDVDTAQRNLLVLSDDSISTQLVAIRHANGRDWWVLNKNAGAQDYSKFLVTPDGVEYTGSQSIGYLMSTWVIGEMCANPQGTQIAFAFYHAHPLGFMPDTAVDMIEVLDFDRCTGLLSNPQFLDPTVCYSLSFSPNGKLLYYHTFDTVYQVAGLDGSQQVSTMPVFFNPYYDNTSTATLDSSYSFGEFELAPDGRVYIALTNHNWPNTIYTPQNMSLCTIDSPDVQGVGCSFQLNSFYLGGKRSTFGLPNMPNYNLGALTGSECDTITSTKALQEVEFAWSVYPNPATKVFQISASNINSAATIEVMNPLGQVVYRNVLSPQNHSVHQAVDVSNLSNGVYVVSLQMKSGFFTRKVVVNR